MGRSNNKPGEKSPAKTAQANVRDGVTHTTTHNTQSHDRTLRLQTFEKVMKNRYYVLPQKINGCTSAMSNRKMVINAHKIYHLIVTKQAKEIALDQISKDAINKWAHKTDKEQLKEKTQENNRLQKEVDDLKEKVRQLSLRLGPPQEQAPADNRMETS